MYKFIGTTEDAHENGFKLLKDIKGNVTCACRGEEDENAIFFSFEGEQYGYGERVITWNFFEHNQMADIKPFIKDLLNKGLVIKI